MRRTSSRPLSRRAFLAASLALRTGHAFGRIPYGATFRMSIPWPMASIDPHDLHDPTAALFATAIFDSLYALDASGKPYPTLADGMPLRQSGNVVVRLRPGIRTARGQKVDARLVAWSLERARRLGARPVLRNVSRPHASRTNGLEVVFAAMDSLGLARALASPLTAIVPRSFTARSPDGTGAFSASFLGANLQLRRNPNAARGSAFLDGVECRSAENLADALRAFEAGDSDLGWLGAGLHRPRSDALGLKTEQLGWILLRTGDEAEAWGAPGVAQSLANAVPRNRLEPLGLGGSVGSNQTRWSGKPSKLLVRQDAPHLLEIATVTAAAIGQEGHPVTVAPSLPAIVDEARRSGRFALMLDVARVFGPQRELALLSLLAAADPLFALKPPDLRRLDATSLTRSLKVGVLGEFAVVGAYDRAFHGVHAWQLGDVFHTE